MNWKRAFVLVTGMLCIAAMSQDGYSQRLKELADYVNPYIGSISPKTGGTSPLVYVPHGTIEVAPDFTPDIGDEYLADKIFGFPAGPASIMATTGELKIDRGENASGFDHTMETATPYYYQALLEDLNINAEYTVTDHSIIFRFTFPESAGSNILMNIFRNGSIEIVGDNSIEGSGNIRYYKSTFGVMADDTVYFHAEFNKPLKVFGTWKDKNIARGVKTQMGDKIGAFISFLTAKDEQVEIKVGTSYNSIDEARANLVKEIPGWDFARVKKAAKESWNKALNLIKTEGGTEDQRISFYTALYRTMGRKGNVWDAYRCAYPLQTIIEPDETVKTIEEFVDIYKKTGWLPSSGAMIGNHSTAVITDAYTKGLRGFDVEKAYEGMKKNATEATMIPWQDAGHITELEKCYFEKGFYPALPVREDMKVQDERKWLADDGEITYSNMPYQVTWLPEVGALQQDLPLPVGDVHLGQVVIHHELHQPADLLDDGGPLLARGVRLGHGRLRRAGGRRCGQVRFGAPCWPYRFPRLQPHGFDVPGQAGQPAGAGAGDQQVVLDPHAADARQVDARLGRHDHAGAEPALGQLRQAGRLVDLPAQPVAETVDELLAETCVHNHFTSGGIHRLQGRSSPGGRDSGRLRTPDHLVNLAQLRRNSTDEHHPRQVAAIALHLGAQSISTGYLAPSRGLWDQWRTGTQR